MRDLYKSSSFTIGLNPQFCPECNGMMDSVKIELEYAKCPNCGYSQGNIRLLVGGITLIVVASLLCIALAKAK